MTQYFSECIIANSCRLDFTGSASDLSWDYLLGKVLSKKSFSEKSIMDLKRVNFKFGEE